ncbi:phosphate acyltransferase PlsX [Terrihabitans rhizophilus]|uniref:Phosphate acyltransferase n=1 Tax=Terrihabitans rhizophilus TaxID=3092662 RepID=A0ABU4RTV8_9HYPH|nr:phosphate acyltransferase PlsX [Terrihabitans sp. PJ23]MDX6807100.1 phosphate acyltransferase PlsX [Terrihabitans sp. PJ23]
MPNPIRIAVDAMGGDHGPSVTVPGTALVLERKPDTRFVFFGRESEIAPLLSSRPALKAASEIVHTDDVVGMDAKPSQALRTGRRSSMWLTVDEVKNGMADIAVSGGNTGALMAMSTIHLRTLAGISRPAIAGLWPTLRGDSVVLDMGATIGADARQLVDFAVMGSALARIVFDTDRPTVGLLNVGVEEMKGGEEVREAAQMLRDGGFAMDYRGFVEGDDIGKGTTDVVVTEGFSGNIALKAAEGTARQISTILRTALQASWRTKIGYLLAKPAFDALREKMDPSNSNGGVFLGLNGVVIKSHGGSDAEGFAAALELGHDMARYELLSKITAGLATYDRTREAETASEGGALIS